MRFAKYVSNRETGERASTDPLEKGPTLRRVAEVISRSKGQHLDIVYRGAGTDEGREEMIFTVTGFITQAGLPPLRETMRYVVMLPIQSIPALTTIVSPEHSPSRRAQASG